MSKPSAGAAATHKKTDFLMSTDTRASWGTHIIAISTLSALAKERIL